MTKKGPAKSTPTFENTRARVTRADGTCFFNWDDNLDTFRKHFIHLTMFLFTSSLALIIQNFCRTAEIVNWFPLWRWFSWNYFIIRSVTWRFLGKNIWCFFRIQTSWQFLTRLQHEDYHFRQQRDVVKGKRLLLESKFLQDFKTFISSPIHDFELISS